MKNNYPPQKIYKIHYDYEERQFKMFGPDGGPPDLDDISGRELGREAWEAGADEVQYNYDLGLDEHIPLFSRYAKYKTQ